jgi:hypothetical protein
MFTKSRVTRFLFPAHPHGGQVQGGIYNGLRRKAPIHALVDDEALTYSLQGLRSARYPSPTTAFALQEVQRGGIEPLEDV